MRPPTLSIFPPRPRQSWRCGPNYAGSIRGALANISPAAACWKTARCFRASMPCRPASAWSFRNGNLEQKAAYFDPREWEQQEPLDTESYYEQPARSLHRPACHVISMARKISGSRLQVVLIPASSWPGARLEPGSLPCYTFGSMYRENQDVHLARRVAAICKQPYQVVTVDGACLARFPHYAERTLYLTDGCVDISRSPDLYNNQMARQIAPVRMVGTFGSEIIRKAVMFKAVMPKGDIFRPEIATQMSRAAETYRDLLRGHRTSMVAFGQTAAYHFGVLMLEQTQLTLRSPYLDNGIVRTVFRAPRVEQGEDVRLRLIRDGSPALARLRTDRGLGGSNRLAAAISSELSGVHIQGRICLRLRHAAMGRPIGSRVCTAPLGAPVDGPAQAVSLSLVVSHRPCQICARDVAGPPFASASLPESECGRGDRQRAFEGRLQLHHRNSSAPLARTGAPAVCRWLTRVQSMRRSF